MFAAGGANNSQSGDECLDENTEMEDPDQARTFSVGRIEQPIYNFISNYRA